MTAALGAKQSIVTELTGLTDRKRLFRLYARTTLVAAVLLTLVLAAVFGIATYLWGPESGRIPPRFVSLMPEWIIQGLGLTMAAPMTWLGLLVGWFFFRGREHLLLRPLIVVMVTVILHAATLLTFLLTFLGFGTILGQDLRLIFPAEGLYAALQSGITYGVASALFLRYRVRQMQKPDPAELF